MAVSKCPKCSKFPVVITIEYYSEESMPQYIVQCLKCSDYKLGKIVFPTEELAIKVWNQCVSSATSIHPKVSDTAKQKKVRVCHLSPDRKKSGSICPECDESIP